MNSRVGGEVASGILRMYFEEARSRHISEEELCRGTRYASVQALEQADRVDWDTYCAMTSNLAKYLTDKDFEELGFRSGDHKLFPPAIATARLLFTAPEMYLWINTPFKGPGNQLFRCIIPAATQVSKNRIIVTLKLKPGYKHCREFFIITRGAFSFVPTLLGLRPATIDFREVEGGAVYDILCPEGGGMFSWLRRALMWPFAARSTSRELKLAYEALQDHFTELEEAQARIQRLAARLKAAYDVGRLISTDLDLNSTLDAITHALIKIGGFAAASITVRKNDMREISHRTVTAGELLPLAKPLVRPLYRRGDCIGEATLWLRPEADPAEAEDLLTYILPTIAVEIDDALAFKVLNNYRTSLEEKVARRTADLNQLNEMLKEAQSGRDRLFSSISHEFRTPLTLILGPLESVIARTKEEESRTNLLLIRQNARRVLDLINQILDLSKLESGRMTLAANCANIVPFVKKVVMLHKPLADRKSISLRVISDERSIEVYFDREKVQKIISNLLTNAFHFTPAGGRIEVALAKSDLAVQIAVRDTGCGIPAAHLPHIFNRFYQVDDASHNIEGGTGIGLAFVKELVELHHGTIRVSSDVNAGSVFTVELLLGRNHLTDAEIVQSRTQVSMGIPELRGSTEIYDPLQRAGHGIEDPEAAPLLLIVDDNADVCQYIKDSLPHAFNTIVASDGTEGFERAKEHIPDLIISDILMPGMNGLDFCRAIRQETRTSHIPIILLTARAGTENKIQGLEYGADDYLTKPFESRELVARVKNLIEQRQQLRKKFSSGVVLRPGDVAVTSLDDALLKTILASIEKNIADEDFNVDDLAREACLSRAHLNRKLRALTNLSPGELIRYVRLQRARQLLEKNAGSVADIAYQVGFGSPSYFSTCFHERYGCSPSEVRHSTSTL